MKFKERPHPALIQFPAPHCDTPRPIIDPHSPVSSSSCAPHPPPQITPVSLMNSFVIINAIVADFANLNCTNLTSA